MPNSPSVATSLAPSAATGTSSPARASVARSVRHQRRCCSDSCTPLECWRCRRRCDVVRERRIEEAKGVCLPPPLLSLPLSLSLSLPPPSPSLPVLPRRAAPWRPAAAPRARAPRRRAARARGRPRACRRQSRAATRRRRRRGGRPAAARRATRGAWRRRLRVWWFVVGVVVMGVHVGVGRSIRCLCCREAPPPHFISQPLLDRHLTGHHPQPPMSLAPPRSRLLHPRSATRRRTPRSAACRPAPTPGWRGASARAAGSPCRPTTAARA